ncbi:MAG: potassium channel family protein [Vulcanococcus sp.]
MTPRQRTLLLGGLALLLPLSSQAKAATTLAGCTSPGVALQLLICSAMLVIACVVQLGLTTLITEWTHHPGLMHWCAAKAYHRALAVLIGAKLVVLALLGYILMWALLFTGLGLLPDLETSFYFSGITFTSVGYGDVMLPTCWRLLSVGLAVNGLLMAGWSTALLVYIVQRSMELRMKQRNSP